MNRKGVAITTIIIVVLVLIILIYLFNRAGRECNDNSDCDSIEYCGSDFACHEYPTVEKNEVDFTGIGLVLLAGAIAYAGYKYKKEPKKDSQTYLEIPKPKKPKRTLNDSNKLQLFLGALTGALGIALLWLITLMF